MLIKLSFKNFDWLVFDEYSKLFMKVDKRRVKEQNASINKFGIRKSYLSVKLFSNDILEFLFGLLLEFELFPEV